MEMNIGYYNLDSLYNMANALNFIIFILEELYPHLSQLQQLIQIFPLPASHAMQESDQVLVLSNYL